MFDMFRKLKLFNFRKANYCEEVYTTWMATNCRLSCGKCERKIPNAECKDAYDQSCWRWTRDDKCNDRESKESVISKIQNIPLDFISLGTKEDLLTPLTSQIEKFRPGIQQD